MRFLATLLGLGLAALIPYLGVLRGPFLYDDHLYVTGNPFVLEGGTWGELFRSPYPPDQPSLGLYRPLLTASYRLNFLLSGENPVSYHVLNLVAHIAATVLLYLLLRMMFPRRRFPAFAALLFAVHPIHTEAVSWIVGRGEVFAALFSFASMIAWLKLRQGAPGDAKASLGRTVLWGGFGAGSLLLGLLSKEMAVTVPGVLFLYDALFRRSRFFTLGTWSKYGVLFLTVMAYLGLRVSVLGRLGPDSSQQIAAYYGEISQGAISIAALAGYLRLLLVPLGLRVDYALTPDGTIEGLPGLGVGLFLVGALVVSLVLFWRKSRPAFFFFAWFLLALSPVSNIIPIGTFFGERLAYLPSAPFFAGLGFLLEVGFLSLARRRGRERVGEWALGAASVAVVLLGLSTWWRNHIWQDERAFWEVAAEDCRFSHKAHVNLGRLLEEEEDWERAEECYRWAVELRPELIEGLSNLASLLARRGAYEEAEACYRKALGVNDRISLLHYNLADLHFRKGEVESGREALERARVGTPPLPQATLRLAASFHEEGRTDRVLELLKEGREAHPDVAEFSYREGEVLRQLGEVGGARSAYRRALLEDPEHFGASLNLAALLARDGDLVEAKEILQELDRKHPGMTIVERNLDLVKQRLETPAEPPGPSGGHDSR